MPRLAVDPRFAMELRRCRELRGLSVRELARLSVTSKSHIHDIETGRRRPTVEIATHLDQALEANGRLAAMVRPAGPPLDAAERLSYVVAHPRRIDGDAVAALTDLLATQRRLEDLIGSAAVLNPVRAQLDILTTLVDEVRSGLRPSVVDLAGQWAQFAGWLHAANGRRTDAGRWYGRALEWATEAGNSDLAATVLSFRGYLAEGARQYGPMIGLSRAAQRDPTVYAGQRAYSAAQEARGLALVGANQDEVAAVLDVASEIAAAQDPDAAPPWAYFYTPTFFEAQRGIVHRYLGDFERAVEHLVAGLGDKPESAARPEWAGPYLVHLGISLAAIGERDQALIVLDEAGSIAETTASAALGSRVRAAVRKVSARR